MEAFTIEIDILGERIEPCSIKAIPPRKNPESPTGWNNLVTKFHSDGFEPLEPVVVQLLKIIGSVYNFTETNGSNADKTGEIVLSNEQGQFWVFKGVWPISINFGFLEYTSDPSTDIEITWHFTECIPGHLE